MKITNEQIRGLCCDHYDENKGCLAFRRAESNYVKCWIQYLKHLGRRCAE